MTDVTNTPSQDSAPETAPDLAPAPTSTTIARRWLLRMSLICALCLGFSGWGYYDAVKVYPERGRNAANYYEYEYLKLARDKGVLNDRLSIDDPVRELERIREAVRAKLPLDGLDQPKYNWLDQLAVVGDLEPANTQFADARRRFDELDGKWTGTAAVKAGERPQPPKTPKPLERWDIPSQWGIMVVCGAIGLWMLFVIIGACRKTYRWNAARLALTLPDGTEILPADLADVDKRKWGKFLVFLTFKDGKGGPHAGGELKLDLYVYEPLEDWILAMEKAAFPERVAEEERKRAEEEAAAEAAAAPKPE
ncbi:MAG: hypothetical protein SFY95_01165 [Planctomycetota bacterium]|nr:hypothetical protein [Planctomycetota bacterium]